MQIFGYEYLTSILSPSLQNICKKKSNNFEIDQTKSDKKLNIKKNQQILVSITQSILDKIFSSVESCPK